MLQSSTYTELCFIDNLGDFIPEKEKKFREEKIEKLKIICAVQMKVPVERIFLIKDDHDLNKLVVEDYTLLKCNEGNAENLPKRLAYLQGFVRGLIESNFMLRSV